MNSLFLKRSWIEVDLEKVKNNYIEYSKTLPYNSEIIPVLKADAYGHGAVQVAKILQSLGVRFFAVSNLCEAIELRDAGITEEILILGYTPAYLTEKLSEYNIIQTIVSEEHAKELSKYSNFNVRYHFAIDTGMNRIGLNANDLDNCENVIRKFSKLLNIDGLFTHFCVADSSEQDDIIFTNLQIKKFKDLVERVKDLDINVIHCSNSAGGLYYANDIAKNINKKLFVRLGISLYGLSPNQSVPLPNTFKPALTWKTIVTTVRTVKKGDFVGYGRTYIAESERKIATLSVGYADGYSRSLSNTGFVLINGHRAKIVGRICMDQTTVDVTDIPNVKMGDIATLTGQDGNLNISADDISKLTNTINYEVLCGISKRVQRIYT